MTTLVTPQSGNKPLKRRESSCEIRVRLALIKSTSSAVNLQTLTDFKNSAQSVTKLLRESSSSVKVSQLECNHLCKIFWIRQTPTSTSVNSMINSALVKPSPLLLFLTWLMQRGWFRMFALRRGPSKLKTGCLRLRLMFSHLKMLELKSNPTHP